MDLLHLSVMALKIRKKKVKRLKYGKYKYEMLHFTFNKLRYNYIRHYGLSKDKKRWKRYLRNHFHLNDVDCAIEVARSRPGHLTGYLTIRFLFKEKGDIFVAFMKNNFNSDKRLKIYELIIDKDL